MVKKFQRPHYGLINLTANVEPYTYFDAIKKPYYEARHLPYTYVYNEPIARPLASHEMLYLSSCKHPSGIPAMLEKFVWSLGVLLREPEWNDVDFFIRTNSSTFINLEVIEPYIAALPKRRCYAGSIVDQRFISGTCIIISRDVATWISKVNTSKYRNCYDDMAISKMMHRRLIKMRNIPMAMFVRDEESQFDEVEGAVERYPLIRIRNNTDRDHFDKRIWKKIAENKSIRFD